MVLLMFMLFKAKDLLPGDEMGFSLTFDFTVGSQSVLAVLSVNEPITIMMHSAWARVHADTVIGWDRITE